MPLHSTPRSVTQEAQLRGRHQPSLLAFGLGPWRLRLEIRGQEQRGQGTYSSSSSPARPQLEGHCISLPKATALTRNPSSPWRWQKLLPVATPEAARSLSASFHPARISVNGPSFNSLRSLVRNVPSAACQSPDRLLLRLRSNLVSSFAPPHQTY